MFNSIGPTEVIIVLVIALLVFGPKRLPSLGKQLGTGMREFKDSIAGKDDDDDDVVQHATVEAAPADAYTEQAPLEGETVREHVPR